MAVAICDRREDSHRAGATVYPCKECEARGLVVMKTIGKAMEKAIR